MIISARQEDAAYWSATDRGDFYAAVRAFGRADAAEDISERYAPLYRPTDTDTEGN